MHNEKNHSIKHGGGDICKYGDIINMSCDAPEDGHKLWTKEPGGNTNQGPDAALSAIDHDASLASESGQCPPLRGCPKFRAFFKYLK